jgi:cilia- and flagella-associated protein 57
VQEPKELKEKIKAMYLKHITSPVTEGHVEDGMQREYNRQRDYLEKTVRSLKSKLDKDMQLHRTDNLRIMQENVALIKEINELRREIKMLKSQGCRLPGQGSDQVDSRQMDMQRDLIGKLREDIRAKEDRIAQLEAQIVPRPMSRERLPPMEGFPGAQELSAK